MIFIMTSKTFMKKFLSNESYKDILFTQYVLVSTKIRNNGRTMMYDNIVQYSVLYPPAGLMTLTRDQLSIRYKKYLKDTERMHYLANIVQTSMEHMNIIIMTSPIEEGELHILESVKETIEEEFKYPVYWYEDFYEGRVKVEPTDKARDEVTAKLCNKYVSNAVIDDFYNAMQDPSTRNSYRSKIKHGEVPKEAMKIILEKEDLYEKGMSGRDMRETLLTFF